MNGNEARAERADDRRLTSLIGLCRRAGRLGCGTEKILAVLKAGGAALVLLASDPSERTRKLLTDKCASGGVCLLVLPLTKAELGHACGLDELSGCAVTDPGFAKAIAALAGETQSE
jgi:ribosomal protein L7Ae-like RNA K-turn-binding protein